MDTLLLSKNKKKQRRAWNGGKLSEGKGKVYLVGVKLVEVASCTGCYFDEITDCRRGMDFPPCAGKQFKLVGTKE